MKKGFFAGLLVLVGGLLVGCQSTQIVSPEPTNGELKRAAHDLINKLAEANGVWAFYSAKHREKAKTKDGQPSLPVVVAVDPVFKLSRGRRRVNVEALNSEFKRLAIERGLFNVTSTVGRGRIDQIRKLRELINDPAFQEKYVPKSGTMIPPSALLQLHVVETRMMDDDGEQFVGWTFAMYLCDVESGRLVWLGTHRVDYEPEK